MRRVIAALSLAAAVSSPSTSSQVTDRDLVEAADLSGVALSPDGRWLAYRQERPSIAANDVDVGWYVIPVDGSSGPHRIGDGGTPVWNDGVADTPVPVWSANSHWIYYPALLDGAVQIWRAAVDGSSATQITHDAADVDGYALDESHDRLIYRVGATRDAISRAEDAEYADGILIDQSVDPAANLYHNAIHGGRRVTQRITGFWFHHGGLLSTMPSRARQVSLRTRVTKDADPALIDKIATALAPLTKVDGGYASARSEAHDGRGTAFIVNDGTGDALIVKRNDESGTTLRCKANACRSGHIETVTWRARQDELVFTTVDPGIDTELWTWDVSQDRVRRLARIRGVLGGDRYRFTPCAVDDSSAVCVAADANRPPHLLHIALGTGRSRVLFDPNHSVASPAVPRAVPLIWKDGEGRRFTGELVLPNRRGSARFPLFVTYYSCGGYLRGGLGDEFPLVPMAEGGIAALCINRAPASPGFNGNVDQYRIAESGIRSVIDLLDRRGLIDRKHVGMGGLSFGGEVTAWVALHSNLLAAASISSTLLEPAYWWFNGVAGRDTHELAHEGWGLGSPEETPATWKALSPALNVADFHTPLLMQMPEQEFRLNMEFYARLTESNTPAELFAFPDEAHVKYQPRHKLAVYDRNLDWFRFWLLGVVDEDPLKASQFQRWRDYAKKRFPSTLISATVGLPSQSRSQISTSTKDNSRK